MNNKKIRLRFAPSPTGYMHVGNFRSALYAYLFVKKNNGEFILRIEDTDRKREVQGAVEKIIQIINWAGFQYQEGVFMEDGKIVQRGEFGPYIQSERLEIYKQYAQELIKNKTAYYCFCTEDELQAMRDEQIVQKKPPMYNRKCLNLSAEEIEKKIASGAPYVVRQKINTQGMTAYQDMVRGHIEFKNELLDDQILIKSDGYPTYNFANVIDDHLMQISHVFRGEEYISSTPKYIQLYQNFNWEIPVVAHLPLLLNLDKSKLSKRQGDVSVDDYIKNGYLREAIINFVVLLGWNLGEGSTQEIFSLKDLENIFDIQRVHKAGAFFDIKKLDWLNAQYIKKLSLNDLYQKSLEFFQQKDFYNNATAEKKVESYLKKVLTVEQERLIKLSEVGEENKFFFSAEVDVNVDDMRWKENSDKQTRENLEKAKDVLKNISDENWTLENIEKELLEIAGDKRGDLLFPLRAVLTGEKKSPSPFQVSWVLGKEESLKRIEKGIALV
ncbi:MAG: glutamate--tRNA ligase [Parcubacteria group bacterium]|jgi:glutamyl-tRNA synthetase